MVLFHSFGKTDESGLIKYILQGLEVTETKDRKGRLYPSDSAMCERKAVLSSTEQVTKTYKPLMPFYTEAGKTSESVVLRGLQRSGVLLYSNYKLPDIGINLGGYVDGIIFYKGKVWVLELKQVGDLPNSPVKEHESQALLYSAITGLPAILFYVDRKVEGYNTGLLHKEFVLDTSIERRKEILNREVRASLGIKYKVIPEKPEHMKKTHCKYCDFYNKCWGDDTDFENWHNQGFVNTNLQQSIDIQSESDIITNMLIDTTKDRATGVLNFLWKYGKENCKKHLGGSWEEFML